MSIPRTFFIDLATFAKTFGASPRLFALSLKSFSPILPRIYIKLQNGRVSPLHQLWTQALKQTAYFYLMPSRLWTSIFMASLLLIISTHLLGSFHERWIRTRSCCMFWLNFWQHLLLFKLDLRQKGLLSLKIFFGFWLMVGLFRLNWLKLGFFKAN